MTNEALTSNTGRVTSVVWSPELSEWPTAVDANRSIIDRWECGFGGSSVGEMRALARREVLGLAVSYCESLGIPFDVPASDGPLVATGHQPDLYHPGVWIKVFALRRLAARVGGVALDLVVDTDTFEHVSLRVPDLGRPVRVTEVVLASSSAAGTYGGTPVPSASEVERFVAESSAAVAGLEASRTQTCFRAFAEVLGTAAARTDRLSDLVTAGRREYEGGDARYLEVPVSQVATTEAFARFTAAVIDEADRFARAYNGALHSYRTERSIANKAQPFPDLKVGADLIELPFWILTSEGRRSVRLNVLTRTLISDAIPDTHVAEGFEGAFEAVRSLSGRIVPRAVTLSLFVRVCLSDIFVHGTGGARYDAITDAVIREFLGVTPPAFAVASVSATLPLDIPTVDVKRLDRVNDLLGRAKHNPDALLAEIEGFSESQLEVARALSTEKAGLVAAIAVPGANKKDVGARIKDVNASLAALVAPFVDGLRSEAESLEAARADAAVLADRSYPFCLFDPADMENLVR